jgi:hypothetical protein
MESLENHKRAEIGEFKTRSGWDVFVDNLALLITLGAVGALVWKVIEFGKMMSV